MGKDSILAGGDALWLFKGKIKKTLFANKLEPNFIEHILTTEKNYLISTDKGLYKLNKDFSKLNLFFVDEQYQKDYIFHTQTWGKDSILVASKFHGLILANNTGKTIRTWNTQSGLSSNEVYGFLIHKNKDIWLSTSAGLNRLSLNNDNISVYKTQTGLSQSEYNRNSFLQCSDGTMFFGSTVGITYFHPNEVPIKIKSNRVEITEVLITDAKGKVRISKDYIFYPNDRFVEINFFTPNYHHAKQTKYRYKIEGLHNEYLSINTDNKIQFAGLAYGKQKIFIQSRAEGNAWSNAPAIIIIKVKKPFYLQWWFIISIALLLAGSLYLFLRSRKKIAVKKQLAQLEQSRRIQTELEKERSKITSYLHDSLGQNLAVLKMKTKGKEKNDEISDIIENLRDVSKNLYPQNLEKQGLSTTVENLCTSLSERTNILFSSDLENFDLDFNRENLLFYIVLFKRR